MLNQMKSRLAQLEERLKKVSFKHKEVHATCFPKDGSTGVYKEVGHREWEQHPLNLYLDKSSRVLSKIRREMLAILYYIKIIETSQGTNSLITKTHDTINKYSYLFYRDKIEVSILYPKTEQEIKKAKMTRLERMREFPEEQNYSMFSREGNRMVNDMVIRLVGQLHGNQKVYEEQFRDRLEQEISYIVEAGHSEVHDTAVREVVLSILEQEVKKAGLRFSMEIEI